MPNARNAAIPPEDLSRMFHSLAGTAGTYGLSTEYLQKPFAMTALFAAIAALEAGAA
jgi:hypothetical protein